MKEFDKEKVVDEQVKPLMKEVMAICKQHGIPMIANFVFSRELGRGEANMTVISCPDSDQEPIAHAAFKSMIVDFEGYMEATRQYILNREAENARSSGQIH